jgi:hypothetical protein
MRSAALALQVVACPINDPKAPSPPVVPVVLEDATGCARLHFIRHIRTGYEQPEGVIANDERFVT